VGSKDTAPHTVFSCDVEVCSFSVEIVCSVCGFVSHEMSVALLDPSGPTNPNTAGLKRPDG